MRPVSNAAMSERFSQIVAKPRALSQLSATLSRVHPTCRLWSFQPDSRGSVGSIAFRICGVVQLGTDRDFQSTRNSGQGTALA